MRPRQVRKMGLGAMVTNMLYRSVHLSVRQGKEPGLIVSFCAGPVPCTCLVPLQC